MDQDYFTRMMDKHQITGEINSKKLLVLIDKIRKEDTPESKEFLKDLLKEVEAFQATT